MPTLRTQPSLVWERPPESQVTAVRFVLRESETGAEAGVAVVSPEARYASVAWRGAPRLARLHVGRAEWVAIAAEVSALAVGAVVPAASALYHLICAERGARLTCEAIETVTAPAFDLAAALDGIVTAGRVG